MIVGFKFFIQNAYAIPKLRIFDVLEAIQGVLISVESLMDLVGKQVAMTKRGPTWTIFRVKSSHFLVVSDRRFIISFSAAKFSKF